MLVDLTNTQVCYLRYLVEHEVVREPEYVNQREAERRFGASNVRRWAEEGKVKRFYRPRFTEYNLAELRKAAANRQDYDF